MRRSSRAISSRWQPSASMLFGRTRRRLAGCSTRRPGTASGSRSASRSSVTSAALLEGGDPSELEAVIRREVGACAGHPAVLFYILGNEIPAPIVRWLRPGDVSSGFFAELYGFGEAARTPKRWVTYVNYPTTEYLELAVPRFRLLQRLPRVSRTGFDAYLARLQNLAGDRPLVLPEIGLDSRRNGERSRRDAWRGRSTPRSPAAARAPSSSPGPTNGTAAATTSRTGTSVCPPRPRAEAGARRGAPAFAEVPFPRPTGRASRSSSAPTTARGRCASASRARAARLSGLRGDRRRRRLHRRHGRDRPDTTSADQHPNRGLSSARNTGLEAATGEIVAYIDDDARPDPTGCDYLAVAFDDRPRRGRRSEHRPAGTTADRRVRRQCAGRPDPRAALRPRGRAYPRLQHGLPASTARGDRRLRPQLSRRRRRRRHLLALQERGWTIGFSPARWSGTTAATRSGRTGGSSRATARPRRCWKPNGRAVQRPGHLHLERAHLRERPGRAGTGRDACLPRRLGDGPVPIDLRAGHLPARGASVAPRVVSACRGPGRTGSARDVLGTLAHGFAAPGRRRSWHASCRPSGPLVSPTSMRGAPCQRTACGPGS